MASSCGDDLLEGLAGGGEDAFAERQGDALDHFVERALGFSAIGRPGAQMNLNFAGRGENRGLHAGVLRIDRRGALLDLRFGEAGGAQFAIKEPRRAGQAFQARLDFAR